MSRPRGAFLDGGGKYSAPDGDHRQWPSRQMGSALRPAVPQQLGIRGCHQRGGNLRAGFPHTSKRTRPIDDLSESALKVDGRKRQATGSHAGGRTGVKAGRGLFRVAASAGVQTTNSGRQRRMLAEAETGQDAPE